MAAVPFHIHEFEIPTASSAEVIAGTEAGKVVTPAALGPLATLAGITPGAAGLTVLGSALNSDVRNFLDTAPYVATRTAAKALDTTKDTTLILTEAGREGVFNWRTGDYSTQVAADTAEGVYLKADAIATTAGAWVRVFDGIADIRWFGAAADGTDDTAEVNAAIALGLPLTGSSFTYGVTGKISLIANTRLWDTTFKQLAPGASLNVITLEGDTVSGLDLRRVKVDRNGDGTNGGLLDASGTNGALSTAFGMRFVSCSNSHFEDLEVYGDDSGTGILFRQIGETSHIIRPYVHDMLYSRTAATDDQVQGIWFDQCTRCEVIAPRAIDLTGIISGVASRRWTRGIPLGGCTGVRLAWPYVETADQGVDITGGPTPNQDVIIEGGVVRDIITWGFKLANTARRCRVAFSTAYDCGVGFVASPNSALSSTVTTDHSYFVNCVAFATGSPTPDVVAAGGFRVLETAATDAGRARNIWFVNCLAVDEQAVPTMDYGFMSEITDINVAPWFINCESIGHITAVRQGLWRTQFNIVGTVSNTSGVPTGAVMEYTTPGGDSVRKTADGVMEQWGIIDDTAGAWNTAAGALFSRSALLSKNWPVAFVGNVPVVSLVPNRGDSAVMFGAYPRDVGLTSVNIMPWASAVVGAGNAKSVHWHAIGRWY